MKRIYSSKLFISSPRRDKILSNFQSPLNKELVTQLSEYIDDDSQNVVDQDDIDKKESNKVEKETTRSVHKIDKNESDEPKSNRRPVHFRDKFDETKSENKDDKQTEIEEIDEKETSTEEEPVQESTKISACCSINISPDEIKGTLNIDESTTGVDRVAVKDSEVWIYYNDKVNLNNIMGIIIDKLVNTGHDYMEFNRLARSDNAIVFVVLTDISQPRANTITGDN